MGSCDGGHLWLLHIIVILLIMKTRHCISGCGRVKQPCHADAGMCYGGHLLLHAGVPLRFTTCLKSYRPYGAPLPHPTSSRNGIASRHREARSDPFTTDLCKIYFPKKNISFSITYPKANDYSRLQTFNQRVGLDKGCIFATNQPILPCPSKEKTE